jgi:arginyl-tRNA synthetase
MEERIRTIVSEELTRMGAGSTAFAVEWPADMAHGDFAVNAALAASKELGKAPREIAEELVTALTAALGSGVEKIEIAGPGFVNITLSENALAASIAPAVEGSEGWGKSAELGKRTMIEYGNPNPFKEMHIGHLVGTVIGESLSRIMEFSGVHVLRDTFGGDVGPQVAKALWKFQREGVTDIASAAEIGKAYTQGSTAYEESAEAKVEIDALNTRIYAIVAHQQDPQTLSEEDQQLLHLWQKGREVSMEEFNRLFALLGTKYDFTFFDSDTTEPGLDAVRDAVTRGVLEESEGAIIYRGESKGLHTLVFVTSRGTPTYETKDVGLALLKELRAATDEVVILTAIEQQGHFKVVLAALSEIAPALAEKTRHMSHGLLTLTTGKMSSRKGNIITARELIAEIVEKAGERNPDPVIAQQVGIGALKYMVLRSAPGGSIIFDPEKSLSLEGDSGPYLQYALVRARSILEKSEQRAVTTSTVHATVLARLIARFPGVVAKAHMLSGPHIVVQFLTQLAGEWNSYYANERIIGSDDEQEKIALVKAFITTMEQGLWLLGMQAPEKM